MNANDLKVILPAAVGAAGGALATRALAQAVTDRVPKLADYPWVWGLAMLVAGLGLAQIKEARYVGFGLGIAGAVQLIDTALVYAGIDLT